MNRTVQHILICVVVAALGLIGYSSVFDDGREFVNFDDPYYVTKQVSIRSMDGDSLVAWFDTDRVVAGNYHPLTMISLALNYAMTGTDVSSYAITNVALHIANAFLVYGIFLLLFPGRWLVAAVAAVWTCVHPMHVESVAWVSERKDVLYAFFLLLSLLGYLAYLRTRSWMMYGASLLAFVLSCLSKAMAVPLPVVLLAVDYFVARTDARRAILEKLPFFAVSVVIGLVATGAQQTVGAMTLTTPWGDRLLYAFWGLAMYVVKFVVPFGLTAFYARPVVGDQTFPLDFVIAPALVAILAVRLWLYQRRSVERRRQVVLGGTLFLAMIALVLQLLPVGAAMAAERYTYVPYIGILVMLMPAIDQASARLRQFAWAVVAVVTVAFVVRTNAYADVWGNSGTLWTNVISTYHTNIFMPKERVNVNPFIAYYAYVNRGLYYRSKQQVLPAIADLEVVRKAAADYGPGFEMRPINTVILGSLYSSIGDYRRSTELFGEGLDALHVERQSGTIAAAAFTDEQYVFMCRSYVEDLMKLQRPQQVVDVVTRFERVLGNDARAIAARGVSYGMLGNHELAVQDLRRSLGIDPRQSFVRANLVQAFTVLRMLDSAAMYRRHP